MKSVRTLASFWLALAAGCGDKPADTGGPSTDDTSTRDCDTVWFLDQDGDGWGGGAGFQTACEQPDGYAALDGDCDDEDPSIHPDADELCDHVDQDCDEEVDEDPIDPTTWYADADADGYGDPDTTQQACERAPGWLEDRTDCDDTDATIHPSADEHCDGVDENCNGLVDDEPLDPAVWYADADADGFGDHDSFDLSCELPSGMVADDTDCDDTDDTIHPGADEYCDDVDQDCDGELDNDPLDALTWQVDADGDGYGDPSLTDLACDEGDGLVADATDCDDGEALIHPGAREVCGNGSDDDCAGDGDIDCDLWATTVLSDAPLALLGEAAGDRAGWQVASAGDVDGDGLGDILVGAPAKSSSLRGAGAAYLVLGLPWGDRDLGTASVAKIYGAAVLDYLGEGLAGVGDMNGDGFDDFAVGASSSDLGGTSSGTVYLFHGPADDLSGTGSAVATLVGDGTYEYAGYDLAGPGDISGDGVPDLMVGAPSDMMRGMTGRAYLVHGPISGSLLLADSDAIFEGQSTNSSAGNDVDAGGDVDGDGQGDFLIGADVEPNATTSYVGGVFLVHGPASGTVQLSDADAWLMGEEWCDYAGRTAFAGDLDADGYDDVVVGAANHDSKGSVYVMYGPFTGTHSLANADAELVGEWDHVDAGCDLDGAGDVDADGYDDILVGSRDGWTLTTGTGLAYVVLGPISGTTSLANADLRLEGPSPASRAGTAVAGVGDLDRDGYDDFLVGAPDTANGSAFLFFGQPLD